MFISIIVIIRVIRNCFGNVTDSSEPNSWFSSWLEFLISCVEVVERFIKI